MHAARYRWTILIVGITAAMTFGCRGSKPFGRFVQLSEEPQSDLLDVDPPRQRLATTKPRPATDVTVTTQEDGSPRIDRFGTQSPAEKTASRPAKPPTPKQTSKSTSKVASRTGEIDPGDKLTLPSSDAPAISTSTTHGDGAHSLANSEPASDLANESDLMAAFSDYPPEVQREALRRLVAATAKSAEHTSQPESLESALKHNLDHLPKLPQVSAVRPDASPVRLASAEQLAHRRADTSRHIESSPAIADPQPAIASLSDAIDRDEHRDAPTSDVKASEPLVMQSSSELPTSEIANVKTVSAARSLDDGKSMVARASVETNKTFPGEPDSSQLPKSGDTSGQSSASPPPVPDIQSLYQSLVKQMAVAPPGESESARASRMIKLRHLMVLSGNLESAVEQIEGMSEPEQEFLRHQLLGLWTMVDPDGHPVPSRRITTALPQLREAAKFAAAATDSLEVRALSFCTEIESYGQFKTFKSNRFKAGQQVILYCEIENFTADKNADGYEIHLQGSYDIYNAKNEKVVSQLLPADKQVSANYLRDYFIAYQMHLPAQMTAGTYRLQLTMEDVNGKKYGQSSIPYEIAK